MNDNFSGAPLALHDCEVTAARGHETRNGLAFSGLLWVRGLPVAEFFNGGNGGCNTYRVHEREQFTQFEGLARRIAPVEIEHTDHTVGALWDWAMLRDAKQPTTAAVHSFFTLHVLPYEHARDRGALPPRGAEWLAALTEYVTIHGNKRRAASRSDNLRHAAPRKSRNRRPS